VDSSVDFDDKVTVDDLDDDDVDSFVDFDDKVTVEDNSKHDNIEKSTEKNKSEEKTESFEEEYVDLGPDENYIYVDHSNDETTEESEPEEIPKVKFNKKLEKEVDKEEVVSSDNNDKNHSESIHKSMKGAYVKSILSDVVSGETKLNPPEIKTVKGEYIEEEDGPLYKPAPKEDLVIEADIVKDDDLNVLNDNIPDWETEEELNIFNDKLPDWDRKEELEEVQKIVNQAKSHYLDDTFGNVENNQKEEITEIEDNEEIPEPEQFNEEFYDDEIGDGITYYQGSNDINSKLRKNNLYYEDEKPKSVRDSIKGFKKDMKYINKSLKEIENPTHVDYVSVVDRTEEYDPNEYLNRPSDDDSDIILQKEQGLTFAEKEEQRIEKEMKMDALKKEISSDNDVIVTVHEQHRRENLKDKALEDIILSADEDYKEIEKERFEKDNQLKAFDDHKLPGKKNLEDNIYAYVAADEIGLKSSDDLYNKPIEDVSSSVKVIVDVEGPVHVSEVTKRIKESCNIKRAGAKLKKTVNKAIENAENTGDIIKIGDFLYDVSNNDVIIRKRNKPNIDLISDEEISKSIEIVLLYNSNISTNEIPKLTSRNFGFKSTSKKTTSRINSVLDLMIADNKVKITDDIVELK